MSSINEQTQSSKKAAGKSGRPKAFPYLLSTTATLAKVGIRFYEGQTFRYNYKHHRKYTETGVYKVFTALFHNIIIPNAMIARDGKFKVSWDDVISAIKYGMVHSKSEKSRKIWDDYIHSMDDKWLADNIYNPFDMYVNGIYLHDGKRCPGKPYSLKDYVEQKIVRFTAGSGKHVHSTTPSLNRLVNEFSKDRSIADLTYSELVERFGVSRTTAAKFRKYLTERRDSGFTDGDYTVASR